MVTITQLAEQKIKELMIEEKDVVGLRVYVRGGGCHGYQYGMAFESKMADDDTVIEKGDVKVIMDSQSAPLLQGAEVDYVDSSAGIRVLDQESPSEDDLRLRQFLQCIRISGCLTTGVPTSR